jgi:hypothetical protein
MSRVERVTEPRVFCPVLGGTAELGVWAPAADSRLAHGCRRESDFPFGAMDNWAPENLYALLLVLWQFSWRSFASGICVCVTWPVLK